MPMPARTRLRSAAALAAGLLAAIQSPGPPALSSPLPPRDRQTVETLLSQMTLDEKIGQINQPDYGMAVNGPRAAANVENKITSAQAGSLLNATGAATLRKLQTLAVQNTRLHIPLLFGYDIIHGYRTIYPIPLALASSWDTALVERCARMAAREATADGLHWAFSPMVDIARDPRWGRCSEGAGEDPYLGSLIAQAIVRGYQGPDLRAPDSLLACVKHFALYGAAEAGRDYNTVDMSQLKMRQYYLPPYKAAIDAGAASVMTSFNDINGTPATANKWLLTTLLRDEWHFDGLILTDYAAINEMTRHGLGPPKQNAIRALDAGVDMEMATEVYLTNLKQLLRENKITETQITDAARHVLEAKARLGLLDNPYKNLPETAPRKTNTLPPENRRLAREAAGRSIVLLKNKNNLLPLPPSATIALIGPLADDKKNPLGSWSANGSPADTVTLLEALRNLSPAPGASASATSQRPALLHAKGSNLIDDDTLITLLTQPGTGLTPADLRKDPRPPAQLLAEALATAQKADIIVAVLGEPRAMTGEAASRADIGLPENQRALLAALATTGKPIVLVLMNGRPLTLSWENDHIDAILETWFPGTEAGNAIADVLYGNYNPSAKLTMSFPRSTGQIPVYYNHKNTGRPFDGKTLDKYTSRYIDTPNTPLYPFGHGLSYTTFAYSPVTLDTATPAGDQTLHATVTITNTGPRFGEEIVQLYITAPVATVTRSVKDLRHFQKIPLRPGESKTLTFPITTGDLKYYHDTLDYTWDPGDYIIQIAPNSATPATPRNTATAHWGR